MRQSIDNLKGEIKFREKLSRQHVSGEVLLSDYYQKEEHDKILFERLTSTKEKMHLLKSQGLAFSPFLELGAERGQRSLVLTNDFMADGFAADISFHQLKSMDHFAKLFGREKLPLRICCDAYSLPFRNNSLPFVFSYEFLHHFPSPVPIIKEIYRVLSDGYFFFDEEPFKRWLKLALYQKKDKLYSLKERNKNRFIKLFESLISKPLCDEEEHGIIENFDISLKEWNLALSVFENREVDLFSFFFPAVKLGKKLSPLNIFNIIFGGRISGVCQKVVRSNQAKAKNNIWELLGCPNCVINLADGGFDRLALEKYPDYLSCNGCGFRFPIRDGIIFLLPKSEFGELYPEFIIKD